MEASVSIRDRFDAAMQSAAAPTKGKGKKDILTLDPDSILKLQVDKYLEAKAARDQAQAVMDENEPDIVEYCRAQQDRDGFKGQFRKSYQVLGIAKSLRYTTQNRFTMGNQTQDREDLKNLLGKHFDEVIKTEQQLEVRPEVFNDEALMAELLDIMGDRFTKFLRYTWKMTARPDADQYIYKAVSKRKLPLLRLSMRQYKPTLK